MSKFQCYLWVAQHGNQYLPLYDGTYGPPHTLCRSPPPALLPVGESGFGWVPHMIHQHLHNSLYHSVKKDTGIRSCAGSSSPQTSRNWKNYSIVNVYGVYVDDIQEEFVHGKGCQGSKRAAQGVTTSGDAQGIHLTFLVIAKPFCSWNHLQHQGLFSLSRYLLRHNAAGAEHCTAVFQMNLLSSTAHLGSSLLLSGQAPPAMPAMKGAQCTPQTGTH